MKKLRRKNIVAAAIVIFCAAGVMTGAVYADEIAGKSNRMSGLVSAIASKFNLSETEVRAVFDQQREEMETQREQNREQMENKRHKGFANRLAELVSQGKLTQAQADTIKAKKAELEAAREAERNKNRIDFKNMTQDERKAAAEEQKAELEAQRTVLKQWAADNGIAEEYLPMAGMGFTGGGHGRGGGFGSRLPM